MPVPCPSPSTSHSWSHSHSVLLCPAPDPSSKDSGKMFEMRVKQMWQAKGLWDASGAAHEYENVWQKLSSIYVHLDTGTRGARGVADSRRQILLASALAQLHPHPLVEEDFHTPCCCWCGFSAHRDRFSRKLLGIMKDIVEKDVLIIFFYLLFKKLCKFLYKINLQPPIAHHFLTVLLTHLTFLSPKIKQRVSCHTTHSPVPAPAPAPLIVWQY